MTQMKFLLLPLCLIIFSQIFLISCYDFDFSSHVKKLSLMDQFDVLSLAEKIYETEGKEAISAVLNFTQNAMSCNVCSFLVDVLKNYLLQKNGFEKFYELVTQLCYLSSVDNKVCDGAIEHYRDIVVDGVIKGVLDGDHLCDLVHICNFTDRYESIEEFAERVLGDKPEPKEKKIEPRKNDEDYYKALQVTDIHLDMKYKEGTVANCIKPLCCRELGDDDLVPVKTVLAGYYGTIGKCDSNINTVKAFAQKAKEVAPDYIMFTGDNIGHSVWEVTQEEVITATRMQIEAIQAEFGTDTPIYPAIGNHEKAPVDEFHGDERELLHGMAEIFKPYLTDEAYETFDKYGYYSLIVKGTENLRLISLNCLLCDSFNFNLLYDSTQVRDMYKWLEEVLAQAELNGEIVHIMDHIPINNHQHTVQCSQRLKILMDRYQNIVKGYFSAHSHAEYLTVVHEYYNNTKPIHLNYIASGLTTFTGYQPSFRVYLVDKTDYHIQDFIQYRMNLTQSNEIKTPVWFESYNATDLLGVESLDDVEAVAAYNVTPEYVQHKYTDVPGSEERSHDPGAIKGSQCDLDYDNIEDLFNCTGVSKLSMSYLDYLLNKIHRRWEK